MKHSLLIGLLAGLLGFGIPAFLEERIPPPPALAAAETIEVTEPEVTDPETTDLAVLPPADGCILLDVLLPDGSVSQLPLDEYLTGVLLAELPASFPQEAKMAQAVAARTYALSQWASGGKHPNADLCTDSACCQAWVSMEDYEKENGPEAVEQAAKAVSDTDGEALFYGGRLIEATYFSCSGGRTEAAVAVWGSDIPYLQAVDSPGEEGALHYEEEVSFSAEELRHLLESADSEVDLEGPPRDWFGEPVHTPGGGVAGMEIGGVYFGGTRLRKLLSLRSTVFTVAVSGEEITFHTLGNGHRVGMSQYGAKAMAEEGRDYKEILAHYYPGTELRSYQQN